MLHRIITKILKSYSFEVFMVGGSVRDMLNGLKPADFDLVTNATPDQIRIIFEKNFKVSTVGSRFVVSIISNGIEHVDVATYRSDRSIGIGHKDFEIKYAKTIYEDIMRRDLTCNAIAMCPDTCDIIDMYNGLQDLKNRIIRFVGDPVIRIKEDPIRMIRAARFAARLKGNFAKETLEAIIKYAELILYVPKEAIRIEVLKAMENVECSRFFYLLYDTGLLKYIFPALNSCYAHPHGRHHFEDVFEHQMLCGDYITSKCPLTKLTGYLHDCGKPMAYQIRQDGSFIDHHKYGEEILRKELLDLKFSLKEIDFIANLTRVHMHIRDHEPSKKSIRKFLVELYDRNLHYFHFLRLRFADKASSLKKQSSFSECKHLMSKIEECLIEENIPIFGIKDLAINGDDIMRLLNIPSGKQVGDILKYLLDKVLEYPNLNNNESLKEITKEHYGITNQNGI